MHAESSKRWWRILTIVIPFLALTGCGEGDGPTSIPNTAVPPLNLPAGFCDPINFELECEPPGIIWFGGGQTIIVENPDKSGINQSDSVGRMQKFGDQVFGGTRLNPVEVPIDFSAGEAYKIKVWSERPVPVLFKLEETNDGTLGVDRTATHNGGSVWEELCFDFNGVTPANTIGLTIIFDNGVLGAAIGGIFSGDWTFYYDDITQVESCSDVPPTGIAPDVSLYDPAGDPMVPADVTVTAFDSQSVIDQVYAVDETYMPVLAVSSGVGYGANVAQIGFTGGDRGFLSEFVSLDFKVKGMPNNVIFVKLFDGVDSLRINLTSSAYADELTGGWYQVSIPVSAFNGVSLATGIVFESDNTAPMQFTMLLTDIGFTEGGDDGGDNGGGDNGGGSTGFVPEDVIYATDPGEAVDLVTTITAFGTSSTFEGAYALDPDFNPAFEAQSGSGYGLDNIVQLGFVDLAAGFATGYETFSFKMKSADLPGDTIEVKLEGGGTCGLVVLTDPTYSTSLGNGWYQVELPMTNCAGVATAVGVLFERVGAQDGDGGTPFSFLVTDIGFNTVSSGGGNGGNGGGGDGGFVNGDFENGLTGWSLFQFPENVGSITADTSEQGGRAGTVGRLTVAGSAASANDAVISQEFLAAGTVMPGDSIDVTFDLYGSMEGAGGVVFVEIIFLNDAGEDVGGRNFLNGDPTPFTPTSTWTPYSGTVIAGTGFVGGPYDVSGGVVLSLKASCGAVVGCAVDASFDNVTFTITP